MKQIDFIPTRRQVESDRAVRDAVRMRTRHDAAMSPITEERNAAKLAECGFGVEAIKFKTGLPEDYIKALVLGELPETTDIAWLRHRVTPAEQETAST